MQRSAAHRSLAARVIYQAIRDVRNPTGTPTDTASARVFLTGSPMLAYWCEIAELDLSCVIGRARILMAGWDADRRRGLGAAEDVDDVQHVEACAVSNTVLF